MATYDVPVGTVSGAPRRRGGATIADDEDFLDHAAAARRALIRKVPGSGPVRGVWSYMGDVFAVRDNAGATAGVLHRATPTGWAAVSGATLPAGGRYSFLNHNFEGQAASEKMYGANGVGRAFSVLKGGTAIAPTYTFSSIQTNTMATIDRPKHVAVQNNHLLLSFPGGSLIGSATGLPADFTAAKGAFEIACGQEINGLLGGVGLGNTVILGADHIQVLYGNDAQDFVLQDQSQANTGGVEGTLQAVGGPLYLDNRGVRSLTTTDAWGNWVIGTMTADVQPWLDRQREARNVAAGSLRVRSSDQYRLWFESGLGLAIYVGRGQPEMSFIDYGSDEDIRLAFDEGDVEPAVGSVVTGGTSGASANLDRVAVASGSWGANDAAGTLYLYDLDGDFIPDEPLMTMAGTLGRADGSPADDAHKILPRCSVSTEDSDRIERVYFGADNGFVYEAERGRSFDGRAFESYIRLPLNLLKMPSRQKRYHAVDVHADVNGRATMQLSALYEDGTYPDQLPEDANIVAGGGFYSESIWSEFVYDAPLNGYKQFDLMGIGRNVSLLLLTNSAKQSPITLNGASLHYSPRRGER